MTATEIATSVLSLIAGVGIFLIACTMMSSNLEALGSRKLKSLFAKASKSKLLGVGVGAATTAVIQSSSATSVMVIGFVNAGIMTLTQAATVIFGANIGTTITVHASRNRHFRCEYRNDYNGTACRARYVRFEHYFYFSYFCNVCRYRCVHTCFCEKRPFTKARRYYGWIRYAVCRTFYDERRNVGFFRARFGKIVSCSI